jgi:uncharacterized NAD-dependent epimerase/dehydratase family protein
VSSTAAAALYLIAERVLRERRRFGRPSVRHVAIDTVRAELDGAVRVGALTAAQAAAAARCAVLAAETEPVRVEAERQGSSSTCAPAGASPATSTRTASGRSTRPDRTVVRSPRGSSTWS